MELKCYHVDCGYAWDYQGASKFYATCPRCMRKIKIDKAVRLVDEAEET